MRQECFKNTITVKVFLSGVFTEACKSDSGRNRLDWSVTSCRPRYAEQTKL